MGWGHAGVRERWRAGHALYLRAGDVCTAGAVCGGAGRREFVPLAQYVAEPVEGIETPEWKSTDRYVPEEDPLQKVPQRRSDAAVFYYHCDQIGTPQLLTDDDGDVVWEASYKAWGEAREVIARASKAAGIVAKNPLRFQGQQVDAETGLYYTRNRYYDQRIGRFISQDPIGLAGGENLQIYAPNPIDWIDPLGLKYVSGSRAVDLLGKDKSNKSTQNLSEWRRTICRGGLKEERTKFLGDDFVKVGPGKWRSLDGKRQMRVTPSDYSGGHGMGSPTVPDTPHVHFEFLRPTGNGNHVVTKNVHVPLDIGNKGCQ